ncbi:MAG: chromosomal replication initiator protein DnaA [Patescibacteria group bacterium]
MNSDQLWQTCLGELQVLLSKGNFDTWFKDTMIVRIEDDIVTIGTPNSLTLSWLEKKFHPQITDVVSKHTGSTKKITYTATGNLENRKDRVFSVTPEIRVQTPGSEASETSFDSESINPRYTFETFVIGESNRLAHAAAQAISKNPGMTYNPLFLYGGVGLGKTHLMHAIGNEISKKDRKKNILYTTCEKFTNDFIHLVRKGKADKFKHAYRSVDLLMVDDIQFLSGKESTQEEFFHTFNELHGKNKQIVLSADRPPKAISGIEDRLVSRFEWGMIADINPPDFETRIAILQNKVVERKYDVSQDIIHHIAKHIHSNIRELEGALNRIMAHTELKNTKLSLADVKNLLGESMMTGRQKIASPADVLKKVAAFYEITLEQLTGPKRTKELVTPRQIAAYIMREELNLSFPKIGKELGGKDHTTIMHACDKMAHLSQKDSIIKHDIQLIKDKLYQA